MASELINSDGGGHKPQYRCSELPIELLEIICRKIADVADFARFRSVCRSWRYAAKPHYLSPQLPWLLLPYNPTSTRRFFFSFATKSNYEFDLPETLNQYIFGSSNGWFLMFDKTLNVSLFNPLTRAQVHLPPITTFPEDSIHLFERVGDGLVYRDRQLEVDDDITLQKTEGYFHFYALVSQSTNSPSNVDDGLVVFVAASSPKIQYWRPGDEAWTMMDCGLPNLVKTMAFHKGKLYLIDWGDSIAVCDLGPNSVVISSMELAVGYSLFYNFVVTPSEELVLVTGQSFDEDDEKMPSNPHGIKLKYFMLDEREGTMTWMPVEGVGDCTIFLAERGITGQLMFMYQACKIPGCRKNCLCSGVHWKGEDREGRKLYGLDVFISGDGFRDLYGLWATYQPNLMSPSWIVLGF